MSFDFGVSAGLKAVSSSLSEVFSTFSSIDTSVFSTYNVNVYHIAVVIAILSNLWVVRGMFMYQGAVLLVGYGLLSIMCSFLYVSSMQDCVKYKDTNSADAAVLVSGSATILASIWALGAASQLMLVTVAEVCVLVVLYIIASVLSVYAYFNLVR